MLFRFTVFAFVFYLGFAVMTLEFSASKLLGFYYGASSLLWTQLIALILLAMALGYEWGAYQIQKGADVQKSLHRAGLVLGLSLLWIFFFSGLFLAKFHQDLPLMIMIALFWLLPVFLLAFLSPIVFSWSSSQLSQRELSSKMASFSMWGTLGSLVGTFMTSYVLVPFLGLSKIPAFVFVLGALFFGAYAFYFSKKRVAALLGILFGILLLFLPKWSFENHSTIVFEKESIYGRVWVESRDSALWLFLGSKRALQSWILEPEDLSTFPKNLYHAYAPLLVHSLEKPQKALILGHAGGVYTRFLNAYAPNLQVHAVEINPVVTEATLALIQEPFKNWSITHQDARLFIQENKEKFDLIFLDAFQGLDLPASLITQEFFKSLAQDMKKESFLALNLVAENSLFLKRFDATIRSVFPWVRAYHIPSSHNILYVASFSFQGEEGLDPALRALTKVSVFSDDTVYQDEFVSLAERDYASMMKAILKPS